jgi:hypothetical protein
MAGELASDHAAYIKGRVGRAPTAGELYAAHFLGPQGSARLIEAVQTKPGASAAHVFPDAAHANHAIFYPGGRAATVAEVYANLTRTGGSGEAVAPASDADNGFIQYASAGRLDRQSQQDALVAMLLRGTQGAEDGGSGGHLTGSLFTTEMLKLLSEARGKA